MTEPTLPDVSNAPFRGFFPFLQTESLYFFGRDRERQIVLANLLTRRLTLLYGPSGVGKTSLINAGVLIDVRKGYEAATAALSGTPVPATVGVATFSLGDLVEPGEPIVVVFNRWIDDPLRSLHTAILASVAGYLDDETLRRIKRLRLTEALRVVRQQCPRNDILIIFDQFEEYFLYHTNDTAPGGFADEFTRAFVNLGPGVNFLISIREDWLSQLDRFKGDIPNLFGNSIRIDHLSRHAAKDAIVKPIENYNKYFRGDRPEVIVTPEFTRKVLDHLDELDNKERNEKQPELAGQGPIHAPHLQMVMQDFWKKKVENAANPRLDEKTVESFETVKSIIDSHPQKYLGHLSFREKGLAANVLRFLVSEKGTKQVSTVEGLVQRISSMPLCINRTRKRVRNLLEKLAASKLLLRVKPPPGETADRYQLTSDVLTDPIIKWSQDVRAKRKRTSLAFIWLGISLLFLSVMAIIFFKARFSESEAQRQELAIANLKTEQEKKRYEATLNLVRQQDDAIPYSEAVLRGHGMEVTSAMFMPNGQVLTLSTDGSAILWNVDKREPIPIPKGDQSLIFAKPGPKGDIIVTVNNQGALTTWDVATMTERQLRDQASDQITAISFSSDGSRFVAANTKGAVFVWDVTTGALSKSTPPNGKAISRVEFSSLGTYLALASDDNTVRILRANDFSEIKVLDGHKGRVNGLAFSPDEKFLASVSADTTVRIWSLERFTSEVLKGHTAGVNSVDYDDSGKHLLTTSDDTTARIWNTTTRSSQPLIGHTDKVLSGSFSPDGTRAVTASKDTMVRIWSVGTQTSLLELRGHFGEVKYVTYSRDGQFVLTASTDATARVWSVPGSGNFEVAQPTLSATPKDYSGSCPTTIEFIASITVIKGAGPVLYRFSLSDGSAVQNRKIEFDKPGTKYIGWYRRFTTDFTGTQSVEIVDPKDLAAGKVNFTVKCTSGPPPTPTPTATPTPSPSSEPG